MTMKRKKKTRKEKRFFAYTDGSTRTNPGMGGCAMIILDSKKEEILHNHVEYFDMATNNQMELMACIEAVDWFFNNSEDEESYIVVMSDSKYCTLGFTERMDKWESKGWKTVSNKKPKNCMLWRRLHELKHDPSIEGRVYFQWVKGHNGDTHNEIVDVMCRDAWKKELKKIEKSNKENE